MAIFSIPKGSGKWLNVREKSVKSQGILKRILSGNPAFVRRTKKLFVRSTSVGSYLIECGSEKRVLKAFQLLLRNRHLKNA